MSVGPNYSPFGVKLDYGGQTDGMGTPTIADGSIWRYDAASGMAKPWNVVVRMVQVLDLDGNPITIPAICAPV